MYSLQTWPDYVGTVASEITWLVSNKDLSSLDKIFHEGDMMISFLDYNHITEFMDFQKSPNVLNFWPQTNFILCVIHQTY